MSIHPVPDEPAQRAISVLRESVSAMVRGKDEVVTLAMTAILAGGHLLIQDVPGVGKTTLAQALAHGIGGSFARVQFTADLLPGDITGVTVLTPNTHEFVFRPGPIFANVVLADEINRTSPRTQSALLEAMEERKVTTDGVSRDLPVPFVVVATQNPFDFEGTYPLPDSQMDRFLIRLSMGYPDRSAELEVIRRSGRAQPRENGQLSLSAILDLVSAVEQVRVTEDVETYLLDLVRATRTDHRLLRGVSPRGAQALYRAAQAHALVDGRMFVVPEDLRTLAVPVLAHRVLPRMGGGPAGDGGQQAIEALLKELPVP